MIYGRDNRKTAFASTSAEGKIVKQSDTGLLGRKITPEVNEQYPPDKFIPRSISNESWSSGEHLTFELTYGFYKAGTATMAVLDTVNVNNGSCYHVQTTAHSNDFISKLYKVRDSVDTYIDIEGLFSRRFEKHLREGRYKSDRCVDFYHDRLIALNTKEKYALTEMPLYVQDVLSSLYYVRTINLQIGRSVEVITYADGKVYPLKIMVHKREKITVPAGTFNCLKVEPFLQSEGIFKQKGKLTVWLTDDARKMPVQMKSKVFIGSIASKLVKYTDGAAK
ncbi:DUF3108 domain-containing protein [Candidatus Latescibacterota bacterium]